MAKLLVADDSTLPNALSLYLREMLTDDFVVVSAPVVQKCALDAIVVGPGGLTLIAGEGSRLAALQPDQGRKAHPPASHEGVAIAAVRAFLKDTFPALAPPLHYLAALRDPAAEPPSWNAVNFVGTQPENLAEAVMRLQAADGRVMGAPEARAKLAVALHAQRLTVSQRTTRPFEFRSGRPLGARAKTWTIRDAVKHMDRHPQDGIYHLNNGTLAQWLEAEGATDLAELTRAAVREGHTDRRKALEIFLTGTGLAPLPRLATRPKMLDLGYTITGQKVVGRIRLGRGRGRGYLYGNLEPSVSWLEVQPRTFAGEPVNLAVTADTHSLLIGADRYEASIRVHCNAAAEPIDLPVRLRVVGNPAPLNRFLLRPFAGLALGILLGALAGWLWAQVAPALPAQLTTALRMGPTFAWTLAVAVLWGIAGLVRGALQPPAWPVLHATRRWLIRLAIWAPLLALEGYGLAAWWQWGFGQAGAPTGPLRTQAALTGLILAVIPATIAALRGLPGLRPGPPAQPSPMPSAAAAEPSPRAGTSWAREHARGIAWGTLGVILVVLTLAFAPRLVHTEWAGIRSQGRVVTAQSWIETQWGKLNAAADKLVERLYLQYYNRRGATHQERPVPAAENAQEVRSKRWHKARIS